MTRGCTPEPAWRGGAFHAVWMDLEGKGMEEQSFLCPGCTAVKLTSAQGAPYWFRTCDIGGDIWRDGAHIVSFPKGARAELSGRREPLEFSHKVLGITNNAVDTWLLDGVNDAGLVGGLLALYEACSAPEAPSGYEAVMGMELVTALLSRCGTAQDVARCARRVWITDIPHQGRGVPATMHYMFMDRTGACVILEAADPKHPGRLTVYRENLGLLTNSPPYPEQLENLAWYLSQSPELRCAADGAAIDAVTLNGLTVRANPRAPHVSRTGTFPASYAACDRFIRAAVLSYLNAEGRTFPGERMLPLGSGLMSCVFEPHNRGVYHYTYLDEHCVPVGRHESYTQYLVMYDAQGQSLYVRCWDATAWTRVALSACGEQVERHALCREPMAGVVEARRAQ